MDIMRFAGLASILFVASLSADGRQLRFGSYLGGRQPESATSVALDAQEHVWVGGSTRSSDFHTTGASGLSAFGGKTDGFLVRLSPSLDSLDYGALIGGSGDDSVVGVTISDGVVYATGYTTSPDSPCAERHEQTDTDVYVLRLDPKRDNTASFFCFGGSADEAPGGIDVDAEGNVYITGVTTSPDLPTSRTSQQPSFAGVSDFFVTKLRFDAQLEIEWMTYLGGNDKECVHALTARMPGSVFVGGCSYSEDLPITPGSNTKGVNRANAGVFARLDSATGRLLYSSFTGAAARGVAEYNDRVRGLAANSDGDLFVTGFTWSIDRLVTPNAYRRRGLGNAEPFALRLHFPDFRPSEGEDQ